jgi:hypothetical protein
MKQIYLLFAIAVFVTGISFSSHAQNTNKYSGRLTYNGTEYEYETGCAGIKELNTTKIESYSITVYKWKKDKRGKQVLKTHCMALLVERNHSDVKKNYDHIKFTTVNDKGLAPEIEGTSKKITLEFAFDNFTLKPMFGNNSPVGCTSFDEGIKNVVLFVLKEID